MDSDSADPSAFGPRRLHADECARAVRESGPSAWVPILRPWPLEKLPLTPVVPTVPKRSGLPSGASPRRSQAANEAVDRDTSAASAARRSR